MENDKRKEFIKQFSYQVNEIAVKKFLNDTKETSIWDMADGYRTFISDLGEGFLEISENYNMCIEIAKANELIGDVKLKARIKDFSSSLLNSQTEGKILDDIFGMELVTPSERDKEILMLFNHLTFSINRDKKYNKPTGYVAYHCMADFKPTEKNFKEWIKETVSSAKTREYKRTKKDDKKPKNKRNMVSIFPILQREIKNPKFLNELVKCFEEMFEYMQATDTNLDLPTIEFQFKTSEVEENGIRGGAAHSKYKDEDEALIMRKFMDGELIRGVNSPWKFNGTPTGLQLQDFYVTLKENWPFLRKTIAHRRKIGKEDKDRDKCAIFDWLTAIQYPFLKKYVQTNRKYDDSKSKKDEYWGFLKAAMVANIINRKNRNKTMEEVLFDQFKS